MVTMFSPDKNYLILGLAESGKTELAHDILNNIDPDGNNSLKLKMFTEDTDKDIHDQLSNPNPVTILMDDYSTKDNRNRDIKQLLELKKGFIVVSPYVLGINQNLKMSINYIYIPKIDCRYTRKLIHTNYLSSIIEDFETFEKYNENTSPFDFMVIDTKSQGFGWYNSRGKQQKSYTRDYLQKIKDFFVTTV